MPCINWVVAMDHPWDEFFIQKIKEGLEARSQSLTAAEERLLRTSVHEIPEDFGDQAGELMPKAVGALTEAYARDTARKNREQVLAWRRQISLMYEHSQLFVTAVMQEWYLSSGRAQEKAGSGCLPSLALMASIAAAFCFAIKKAFVWLG